MTTTRDLNALATAVTECPGDHTVRLVYADALEEAGQDEEASAQRQVVAIRDKAQRDKAALLNERRAYYEEGEFSNVYTVYAVPLSLVARFEVTFPDAYRIDRKRAIRRGISRPAEAHRDNEQWWGGLCSEFALDYPPDRAYGDDRDAWVGRCLNWCTRNTVASLEQREMLREAGQ